MGEKNIGKNVDDRAMCQIFSLPQMSDTVSVIGVGWQFRKRLKRMLKRRYHYFLNFVAEITGEKKNSKDVLVKSSAKPLQSGDMVRVKSEKEIKNCLNRWNKLKGCAFMEEMWPYCGTTQRVLKRVEKFLDERDYLTKKCKGIVILDGVMCQGTKDFGPCDRSCFYFWREEWLEKM